MQLSNIKEKDQWSPAWVSFQSRFEWWLRSKRHSIGAAIRAASTGISAAVQFSSVAKTTLAAFGAGGRVRMVICREVQRPVASGGAIAPGWCPY
jgi:hypothetical protein